MAGNSIINYKGKKIFYSDYRGTQSEEEMIDILEDGAKQLIKANKPMLLLTNITGVYVLYNFMKKAKEISKKTQSLTLKEAIVGITGAKKILLKFYNQFTGIGALPFDNEEEAKEYLVKD